MQPTTPETTSTRINWLERPVFAYLTLNWETLIFALILALGLFTRFYDLEARVMSHDENSHVYYSWRFSEGMGYSHNPITHGPLQFHLVAFSYFMFGANDFTARIPAVLFSIATIAFVWAFRRYLGKAGTLITAGLMLISPYILYYGRYVRNEAFVALFGLMMLWAILRYLESGQAKYTYWLTAASVLHYATKETAFIYTAQALVFLGLLFVYQTLQRRWAHANQRSPFIVALIFAALMLALAALLGGISGEAGASAAGDAVETTSTNLPLLQYLPLLLAGLGLLAALYFAIHGLTWQVLREDRAFSLIVLQMVLILPQLAPFPVSLAGWDPTDYSSAGMVRTGIFVALLAVISLVVGLLWNRQLFLINAAIFYIPFTVFYTSIFTNGQGFFTGLVGSLGYWVKQQAVQRGSQPWYYYLLVQIPVYEFLPAIGLFLAGYYGLRLRPELTRTRPDNLLEEGNPNWLNSKGEWLFVLLTIYWSLSSLLAYSYAGEKMPWLTVHITLAMILASGWALGKLVERIDWQHVRQQRGWLLLILLAILLLSLATSLGSLLGDNPPFQGKELQQLNFTSTFLTALLTALACGYGVYRLLKGWQLEQIGRLGLLVLFSLLGVLTARAAIRAAYINYDYPTEYLVYAHSAHGVKEALAQIEELSYRTTDGLDIVVAYDNETTYPFWWYLRDYPNQKFYAANPTRELRDAPVILVGAPNYARIEPVVGQAYYQFDYKRIWWPNQDYYNLTWQRIARVFTDPQLRAALWDIWYDRDYSAYAAWGNKNDLTLPNWQPSQDMRLYVRKDIAAQVWNMGASPAVGEALLADPYEDKQISLTADRSLGGPGNAPGQFQTPRNAAVAPDGTIYVADTNNHRIQHLSPDGQVLHTWGSFADGLSMENGAPPGSFYEPWSLAVAPDGSVFVADTWNHRIQKFSTDGTFITQWGVFGQAETGGAFWGPRDIAIGPQGHVYVTDTGNKRIAIFDQDGNFITQFGEAGLLPGQLDEPVGLAVDDAGRVYVADTWNQRIQVFQPDASGLIFTPVLEWPIVGWYGQSLDNKPYLAVDNERLYVSDPEGYRILVFDLQGQFLYYWGDYGSDLGTFILPTGLATDGSGGLWVIDTGNQRLVHFKPPTNLLEQVQESEQPVQELQLDEP